MTATATALSERMPRLDGLTGLRWWAALFVFCYHMLEFAPLPSIAAAFLKFGYLGVTFFFVLSGFVLTWAASPNVPTSTFYWRRFARIYPSHFVALLLAIPVFYSMTPDTSQTWVKPFSFVILLLSFLLLQGWSTNPAILFSGNPAAWTLTCEAFFYAMHPLLSRALYRFTGRSAAWLAAAVGLVAFSFRALTVAFPNSALSEIPLPPVRITEFAAGMALAWSLRTGWRPKVSVFAAVVTAGVALTAIALVPRQAPESLAAGLLEDFTGEIIGVVSAIVILAVATHALAGKKSVFAKGLQVRLGEYSYAFYLVHATIMYAVLALLGVRPTSWLNLGWWATLCLLALGVAAALHHLVEKPFETRMRAWKDARA